jgi:hypothetical protein
MLMAHKKKGKKGRARRKGHSRKGGALRHRYGRHQGAGGGQVLMNVSGQLVMDPAQLEAVVENVVAEAVEAAAETTIPEAVEEAVIETVPEAVEEAVTLVPEVPDYSGYPDLSEHW